MATGKSIVELIKYQEEINQLKSYHYFANHYIYNETELKLVMHPDTVYIATMRNPLAQLRGKHKN